MDPRICFLNGRYVETRHATVPATDRGFLFGEGLFETWRTYRGRPFALEEHLRRMARSARQLGIPFDADGPWAERTRRLVKLNSMTGMGSAVRLTITRGTGPVRLAPGPVARPTRLMLLRRLDAGLAEARTNGVGVNLLDFGVGGDTSMRRLKTINYLSAVIGKTEAARHGCFESIYRLADGTLLEGMTTNVFVVRNSTLVTPPVADGVLPGVTRAIVLEIAKRIADVREARITTEDLLDAEEAFLTSTTIEIVPIVRVRKRRAGGGCAGVLTRELQRRYRRRVARRVGLSEDELGE